MKRIFTLFLFLVLSSSSLIAEDRTTLPKSSFKVVIENGRYRLIPFSPELKKKLAKKFNFKKKPDTRSLKIIIPPNPDNLPAY